MYKIGLSKKVLKFLEKHKGEKIINSFNNSLKILQINPYKNNLDFKKLKGVGENFRLRIGKYRFIYEINNDTLIIYFIDGDTRGDIY
ncbi:MAG: type II toxin-antitoxin system RelE/ParE family toxin [Candidatus Gracilibacteria bacterium]|nr:type II toxin-antitoxin system RelE/ParE family toxin [Candidatus Gracilibacteria bacterium]